MTNCPNPNRIIEYLQDALPPQAAEEMRQHLIRCSACRARAEAIGLPDASPTVETAVTSFGMGGLTTGRALITSGLPKEVPAVPTDEMTDFTHDFSYGLDGQSVSSGRRSGDAASNIELSIPSLRALNTVDRLEAEPGMLKVGTKIAHYVVTRLLGRGGMGEVYLARDTHLGRKVALKVIRPNHLEDQDSIDRFLLEARMTARFNHPHIITIYGVGVHDGLPYVALEYLEGQNLRERCRDEQPTLQESLRICLAVGEAVTEAHRNGVLHRDLKPANILIPKDGRLRVADFGLAQEAGFNVVSVDGVGILETQDGSDRAQRVIGTPAYMAPEQWSRKECTSATDVWSLGTILHELIVGSRPYGSMGSLKLGLHVCSDAPTPISPALSGVPSEIDALVRGCLEKKQEDRPDAAYFTEVIREVLSAGRRSTAMSESPFRGLMPFSERHSDLFFGREDEITSCIERLRYDPSLAIIGPSGAGKTSFVQAGLIPRLKESGVRWLVVRIRPGDEPLKRLAAKLVAAHAEETGSNSVGSSVGTSKPTGSVNLVDAQSRLAEIEELAEKIRQHPNTVHIALARLAEQRQGKVLLLIDQLEEVFTLCRDLKIQETFLRAISSSADDAGEPVRFVCTVRDDFLGHMARLGDASRTILERVMVLTTPGVDSLKNILVRPLLHAGYQFDDPTLADEMIAAVDDAASLPLLQFAARSLWERRDQVARQLRRRDYEAMGGVEGALARHADGVLHGLSPEELLAARAMLLRLVTPDNTRRSVSEADLLDGLSEDARLVFDRLTKSRLVSVRKGSSSVGSVSTLELAHESLVVNWSTLAGWIAESKDELVFLAEVGQAAELWDRRGRQADELWVGHGLRDAIRSLERATTEVPRRIRDFVEAGRRQRDIRVRRRRFWSTAIPIIMTIVALIFAVEKHEADVAREQSDQQRRLAVQERLQAEEQRRQARLRQVEAIREGAQAAYDRNAYFESRAKLRSALELSPAVTSRIRGLWWQLKHTPILWSQAYGSVIYQLRYSHNGSLAAAATQEGKVFLFDASTGEGDILRGRQDQITSVAFSHDDRWLASAGYGGRVDLWDVKARKRVRTLTIPNKVVVGLRFSPNRDRLVAGIGLGLIRVWRTNDWTYTDTKSTDQSHIRDVAFTPDGSVVVARRNKHELILTGQSEQDIKHRLVNNPYVGPPFYLSGDGRAAVSMGRDGRVSIWDTKTGEEMNRFDGGNGARAGITLNHTAQRVGIAGSDGVYRIYDVKTGREMGQQDGGTSGYFTQALSPDGSQFISTQQEGHIQAVRVAKLLDMEPVRTTATAIYGLAVGPRARWAVSVTMKGKIGLFNLKTGQAVKAFRTSSEAVRDALAFSPDGRYLAWADTRHRIRLWDLKDMRSRGMFEGHQSDVRSLGFTQDSRRLKSVGGDGFGDWDVASLSLRNFTKKMIGKTIMGTMSADADRALFSYGRQRPIAELWSMSKGQKIKSLVGHSDAIYGLGIDPRARWILTGSWDGKVYKWNTRTGERLSSLRGGVRVNGAAVHPSGELVATAGADHLVRLYRGNSTTPLVLEGHVAEVNNVAFTGDGDVLVSGGDDGTLRPWRVRDGRPLWTAQALLSSPALLLTHEGWFDMEKSNTSPIALNRSWARRARLHGRRSANTPGQPWLCIQTYDGRLELWDMAKDARQWSVPLASSLQVLATGEGCIVRSESHLVLYPVNGAKRSLVAGMKINYVESLADELIVVGDTRVKRQRTDGQAPSEIPIQSGVTVATFIELPNRDGKHLLLGYQDGSLELRPTYDNRLGLSILKDQSSFAPVTAIVSDDRGYAAIGYANGVIGLWDLTTGRWLGSRTLHGSVVHLAIDKNRLYGVTDLGRSLRWDLSVFRLERCELLRQVWSDVPYTWNEGKAILASVPETHACVQ